MLPPNKRGSGKNTETETLAREGAHETHTATANSGSSAKCELAMGAKGRGERKPASWPRLDRRIQPSPHPALASHALHVAAVITCLDKY